MHNELITTDISKAFIDETAQALEFLSQNISGHTVVQPVYSRSELLYLAQKSAVNMRCLQAKAATIAGLGYEFADPNNAIASGVQGFIDGLIDVDGSPVSFSRLLQDWILDAGIYAKSRLEIIRMAAKPINLYLLSSKNIYVDANFEKIIQYVTKPSQQAKVFRPYGEYSASEHDTLCFSFGIAGIDDFYSVPVFAPAMQAIKTNISAGEANQNILKNSGNESGIFVINTDAPAEWHEQTKAQIRALATRQGSKLYIALPNSADSLQYLSPGQKQIDGNYINERNKNELEIMACHGLTPELYGVLSNGGISSGEKATGALKIFLQTVVRPAQESLQRLLDNFFKAEFPGYDAGFQLKTIDLTDKLEDIQSSNTFVQTVKAYVDLNNLRLLNEFMTENGYDEVTQAEWDMMRTASTGVDFSIAPA